MAQVIHIRRQPNGWDKFGQGIESAVDKYTQGSLAMAKDQNVITQQMLQHALGERRLNDQNARDDRRRQEQSAMQERRLAQEDKWKAEQLDLQKQQIAAQNAAQARAGWQITNIKDAYGNDAPHRVNIYTGQMQPLSSAGGGTSGAGNPQLDAILRDTIGAPTTPLPSLGDASTAQPFGGNGGDIGGSGYGLTPVAPAAQAPQMPSLNFNQAVEDYTRQNQDREAALQRWVLDALKKQGQPIKPEWEEKWGAQVEAPQATAQEGLQQEAPAAPQAGGQQGTGMLQPGAVVDSGGNTVEIDMNRARWGKQEKVYIGGKEYFGQTAQSPRGSVFKVGGEVPKSALERKEIKEIEKMELQQLQAQRSADIVVEDIGRSLGKLGWFETGLTGKLMSNIPSTDSHDVNQLILGIRGNIGFDRLQQMRSASPTGGALGAVTIGELERLEAVYGSLNQSQSEEQLRYNLSRLRKIYLETIHGPESGGRMAAQIEQQESGGDIKAQADALINKHRGTR